ncbi:MAG: transposase [Pseudomonadota bacterium]
MARAKRHYIPGHAWHITQRCHKRDFLLKFPRDRRRWIEWLYRARKKYPGLSVLDNMVTSNHIHLLVYDTGGRNVIPDSIKLIGGRTGQEYNIRKNRKGAFWEDRYHATAVESGRYLRQCIAYIDMNMVRAGVVKHPSEWGFCGYNEIQNPRKRKGIIDFNRLIGLLGLESYEDLKDSHFKWIESRIEKASSKRELKWSQSVAVGSAEYLEKIKRNLGFRAKGRKIIDSGGIFELREGLEPCRFPDRLGCTNISRWNKR